MKKIKKIIISSLLFVAATTSTIGIIGLTSCSGATVEPPIEPPKPPIVVPPTPIIKMVKVITGLDNNLNIVWESVPVKEIMSVSLVEYSDPIQPGFTHKYKFEKYEGKSFEAKIGGDIVKQYEISYKNWLKVSNDK